MTLDVPPHKEWPKDRPQDPEADISKEITTQIDRIKKTGLWKEIGDPLEHIPLHNNASHAQAYAEFAFFHDFIQSVLFKKPEGKSVFRLFTRKDVKNATLDCGFGAHLFRVERLSLYVFEGGLAFLVLELAIGCPWSLGDKAATPQVETSGLTLEQGMQFNDRMRRAHAPFLIENEHCHPPAFAPPSFAVPNHVSWRDKDQKILRAFDIKEDVRNLPSELSTMTGNTRTLPPFEHWSWLLNGETQNTCCTPEARAGQSLPCKGWKIGAEKGAFTWRHVADDRLPILSTIVLPSKTVYNSIREGDWMRLAFVDPPGEDKFPYAKAFLEKDWHNYTYDRFHYNSEDPEESKDNPSRYLISGYSFLAVGCGKKESAEQSFFEQHITHHMRRHYFQLILLAQLEKKPPCLLFQAVSAAPLPIFGMSKNRKTFQKTRRRIA